MTLSPTYHVAVAVAALAALPAAAEEINWRHDLRAARREASDRGLPLLIDVSTAHCFWCQKLDATTFRDPAVARLVNERFIAVKADGEREGELTRALAIQGFPTLVFAAPDGRVLGKHEGYLEPPQLIRNLQSVITESQPRVVLRTTVHPAAPTLIVGPAEQGAAVRNTVPAMVPDRLSATLVGDTYLGLAEDHVKHGRVEDARACLERVLVICPSSGQARMAQDRLQTLTSGPNARGQSP